MAGYSVLASRYAHSLLSLAQEKGLTETVQADLMALKGVYNESAELRSFLKSPVIHVNTKKAVMEKAFGSKISKITLLFLEKLAEGRREMLIGEIADAFNTAVKKNKGIVTATVVSAAPINEKIRAEVTKIIKTTKNLLMLRLLKLKKR